MGGCADVISYVLPTRDRPTVLARTLAKLGELSAHEAEVIVVDNASAVPVQLEPMLANGVAVRVVRLERNAGAAGRNVGAAATNPASRWIVMLDDDSYPLDVGHLEVLRQARPDVAAIGAEIWLPAVDGRSRHEAGGLPEVIVGCGAAIRRNVFLEIGGYDEKFDYYAEEYDLCARLILRGWLVAFDTRFSVIHHKERQGRNFSRIVRNLTRNNAWVMQRYAPEAERTALVRAEVARYRRIAAKEWATAGWMRGVADLAMTLWRQPRMEMNAAQWARFTGLAAARQAIAGAIAGHRSLQRVAIVAPGKNEPVVRRAVVEAGLEIVEHADDADALLIGTLSPGPMLDAAGALRASAKPVIVPFAPPSRPLADAAAA